MIEIHDMVWNRHNTVEGLNRLMGWCPHFCYFISIFILGFNDIASCIMIVMFVHIVT